MFIRFQNSCTYFTYNDHFEIKSDVFNMAYRFKGFAPEFVNKLLKALDNGVDEEILLHNLSPTSNSEQKKLLKFIEFLKAKGLLIRCHNLSSTSPEDTLYDRQIRFFNSFEFNECEGKDFNAQLQNKKIVIVGLGAYGNWLALHCARLGIKHIIGIDHDVVELSNLHRQVLFTQNDIGVQKAIACSKALTASDSGVTYEGICKKIESETDLLPYLEDADFIFNAFGYYPEEEAKNAISGYITKASIITKTPMLCLSTNWIGPLYIPGKSACYFCTVMLPELRLLLKQVKKNPRIDKRAFCPILSITCSLAVLEAVRYLTQINIPSTVSGVTSINPFQIEKSMFFPIPIKDDCPYCQSMQEPIKV